METNTLPIVVCPSYLEGQCQYWWERTEGLTKDVYMIPEPVMDQFNVLAIEKEEIRARLANYYASKKDNGIIYQSPDYRFEDYLDDQMLHHWVQSKHMTENVHLIPEPIADQIRVLLSRYTPGKPLPRALLQSQTERKHVETPVAVSLEDIKLLREKYKKVLMAPQLDMFEADFETVRDMVNGLITDTLDGLATVRRDEFTFTLTAGKYKRRYVIIDDFAKLIFDENNVYVLTTKYTGNDQRILGMIRDEKMIYFTDVVANLNKWIEYCYEC